MTFCTDKQHKGMIHLLVPLLSPWAEFGGFHFCRGKQDYYNIRISMQWKLIGLINIQANGDTTDTFH